jgi:hypothetical protein
MAKVRGNGHAIVFLTTFLQPHVDSKAQGPAPGEPLTKIDWHNYEQIEAEKQRTGGASIASCQCSSLCVVKVLESKEPLSS